MENFHYIHGLSYTWVSILEKLLLFRVEFHFYTKPIIMSFTEKFLRPVAIATLFLTAFAARADYSGTVFVDSNANGVLDNGEKPLKGVAASDGLNVVKTDAKGHFTLPGFDRERFVFITTPSGYLTHNRHYIAISPEVKSYDFGLIPYDARITRDGKHSFIQVTDTEIFNTELNEDWVDDLRRYAANEGVAFIIHTGDICYNNGLRAHIRLMNTANMGVPVFYGIGNHDLVKGKYGEELFESLYGPVYYSFDVNGTHYVMTPMAGGDHAPSYSTDQVVRWLRNDLANVPQGTPLYFFNHDLPFAKGSFTYKGRTDSLNLTDYNIKGWIYGHYHINHKHENTPGAFVMCTSTPDKGGIDHSTSAYRVVHVDRNGNSTTELRYSYLRDHAVIASPAGRTSAQTVTVNAYSSITRVKDITYTCFEAGKAVTPARRLTQATDWTWTAPLQIPAGFEGKRLTVKATVTYANGNRIEQTSDFIYSPSGVNVDPGTNWDNLLGNAAHNRGLTDATIDSIPALAWVSNVGANIFMTSPLIHDGHIYTASVDEEDNGCAAIYALNIADGSLAWRYPVKASIKNTIAITDNKVFAQDVMGNLYAVNCADGSTAWTATLPVSWYYALIEGLATTDNTVFAGTGRGLAAFDARTGRRLWLNNDWSQAEGTTSTLSVGAGAVLCGAQWSALFANNESTGKKLWSIGSDGLSDRGASPVIVNGLAYVPSRQSFFIIDVASGRIVTRKELPVKVDVTSSPLIAGNEIVFGTSHEGIVAVDASSLELKWKTPTRDALIYTGPYTRPVSAQVETSPVATDKYIYVAASDGTIYGLERGNGRVRWRYKTGAPIFSSVAPSGNILVATDFGGNVYCFGTPRQ